ncbi:MAG: DnaJ domain-containing protein [Halovenus sp.]
MGETFYTILDVAPDADRETIRRAYRDRVKDVHPDVSDDPDATETFKQLTTTRDVLLDREKRTRYDRLGHDTYVREHVSSPVWSPSETGDRVEEKQPWSVATHGYRATAAGGGSETAGATTSTPGETQSRQHRTGGQHEVDASTGWAGTSADYRQQSSRDHGTRSRRGTFVQDSWQTASEAYRRSETEFDRRRERTLYDVGLVVRRLAPWLFIHTVLIVSTLATVWFTYSSTNPETGAAASTFVGAVALVSVMIALSVFHLLSVFYT